MKRTLRTALLSVVASAIPTVVFAATDPSETVVPDTAVPQSVVPQDTVKLGSPEKTYYNDAEASRGRDREAAYLASDPGMATVEENERVRRFQLTPVAGFELVTLNRVIEGTQGTPVTGNFGGRIATGPVYGLSLDWRLGYFTFGARYQGSAFVDNDPARLDVYLNKVYLDFGINARAKVLLFSAVASGGYAFAATSDTFNNGAGGRFALNFDFLVSRAFSIGPGFAFEVQGYQPQGQPIGTWVTLLGFSSNLRFGFHI